MLVGLIIALQLAVPALNLGLPWLTFGRLRPLHTNAAIFAFAGNAIFAGVYYSHAAAVQGRMFSDTLSACTSGAGSSIIVAAAITLPLGITQGKEYAELEWPIDLAIAVVWVGFFGVNFFMTLAKRRERHMYVALWFYIATIVTVTVLHVFNSLVDPGRAVQELLDLRRRAGRLHAVVVRPQRRGVLPDHAVPGADVLLPAQGGGAAGLQLPAVASSTSGRWCSSTSGPGRTICTTPRCRSGRRTLGMLFSLMLWMPSWGGMINGLLTLRGAWNKVADDPVLKFFVVGITFYGMSHVRRADALDQERQRPVATTPTGPSPTCTPARWAGTAS